MNNPNDDLQRRIGVLEEAHREVVLELRESTKAMNKLAIDIHSLVVTVGHISGYMEATNKLRDKTHEMDMDVEILKEKVKTVDQLNTMYSKLKEEADKSSPITNLVRVVFTSAVTTVLGFILLDLMTKSV